MVRVLDALSRDTRMSQKTIIEDDYINLRVETPLGWIKIAATDSHIHVWTDEPGNIFYADENGRQR